ncbi:zinc finger protein 271-like isoform X3 [Syngnathoides biaculeatus]|uniref:zinc finger protein 271-like isoform X3 n=1 Tax=Syngnathoides biaculeatus TaxID=300417 RepID=UPI002ADD6D47|nr:zinc finger protein 271-like isoform X3 [Syngnathoides biaculeatus]
MCTRMAAEYEEELWEPKNDNEHQPQLLLEAFCQMQPRVVLHKADASGDIFPKQLEPEFPSIKEEEENEDVAHFKEEDEDITCMKEEEEEDEVPHIKEEEEAETITKLPLSGVPLKSRDEGLSETSRGLEPRKSSNCRQHVTAESDGDHNGGLQADGLLAPLSDSDEIMSHAPHPDDDDNDEGHKKGHTDDKRWKCSPCGKTFTSKWNLKQHMRTHTGEKPFACSYCGQRFSEKGSLTKHTRKHTGEKPFSCSICSQRFSQKGDLKIHTRTHTGEKPFTCSVCSQRFSRRGILRSHSRIHTGEKPFVCLVCGQRFSRKGILRSHSRTHTGDKPFACLICGQSYSLKGYLKRHARTHTGDCGRETYFPCRGRPARG